MTYKVDGNKTIRFPLSQKVLALSPRKINKIGQIAEVDGVPTIVRRSLHKVSKSEPILACYVPC